MLILFLFGSGTIPKRYKDRENLKQSVYRYVIAYGNNKLYKIIPAC